MLSLGSTFILTAHHADDAVCSASGEWRSSSVHWRTERSREVEREVERSREREREVERERERARARTLASVTHAIPGFEQLVNNVSLGHADDSTGLGKGEATHPNVQGEGRT